MIQEETILNKTVKGIPVKGFKFTGHVYDQVIHIIDNAQYHPDGVSLISQDQLDWFMDLTKPYQLQSSIQVLIHGNDIIILNHEQGEGFKISLSGR